LKEGSSSYQNDGNNQRERIVRTLQTRHSKNAHARVMARDGANRDDVSTLPGQHSIGDSRGHVHQPQNVCLHHLGEVCWIGGLTVPSRQHKLSSKISNCNSDVDRINGKRGFLSSTTKKTITNPTIGQG
jgi:hypothetical protein